MSNTKDTGFTGGTTAASQVGWAHALLCDICTVNPPKPAVNELATTTPVTFVPMPAVDADAGAITNPQSRAFGTVRKGFTSFRDGDVIVAKITPCFENGKAAVCHDLLNGMGFGSTEFHVLRSTGAVLPEYVYHFVRQESFRRDAAENMTGSVGQERVPAEYLGNVELPLPPLAEQKQIVAKVEALLARVNAARERLAKVPTLLKRFRQSVLAAACSGELTADWRESKTPNRPGLVNEWTETTIANVCDVVVDCPHSTPKWTEGGVICLRTTNFQPGSLDLSEVRYVSEATYRERVRRTEPSAGDVLYSREGGILGVACIMPEDLRACLGQRMMLLRPSSRVLSSYLMHLLNSPATLAEIGELTGGTASPHLNVADVKAFSFRLPSPDEQHEIIRRVKTLFALADKIEARVQAATARVEKITQAILAKAFRGELVPTEAQLARQEHRAYEPASVLLERIRATRAAGETSSSGRTRRRRGTRSGECR